MAKEEKLLHVQSKLNDRDFEDVYRIYLATERGRDRRISMIICAVLAVICIIMFILWGKNITFLFYAAGALIVGMLYYFVPSNKKFIAANKLQFGEWRETAFFPHHISTIEIFSENELAEMDADEIEDATTTISTVSLKAYENERGFLFADGKISAQFLYVPKRSLKKQELEMIREFAEERCSGGYLLLEMKSMLTDEDENEAEENTDTSMTSAVCDQYYGANHLRLYDSEGRRVDMDADEEAEETDANAAEPDEADAADLSAVSEADTELDVDAEWEKIVSDDTEGETDA